MWILWTLLGLLVFFLLLFLFAVAPAARRHPDRKILDGQRIAHRGLHDLSADTPENSLAAFEKAASYGFMIENDIHLTADGEVVVFHDDDMARMCGVSGRPEDMTLAQIRALRLNGTDEGVPTLRECLDVVDGRVPLLIEFKCRDRRTCTKLCEAADAILADYHGKYLIQSFYPFVLTWYRRHRCEICRGQLATAFRGDTVVMRMLGALLFNFFARPDFVSYEHIYAKHFCRRLCTGLGAFPVCWTLHTEEELQKAKDHFCTFIFEGFLPEKKS